MGHVVPDRLFWAQAEDDEADDEAADATGNDMPPDFQSTF